MGFQRTAGICNLLVGAKGSPLELTLNALYHMGRSPGNVPFALFPEIESSTGVQWAIPLALGDSFGGHRVVGTTDALFSKIDFGPIFVRTSRDGKKALEARLTDKHVARLIKQTVQSAGIRSDLPEKDRLALFSGHSLRAGLASSAEVDERYAQKQLGHATAEMTRHYQRRRDRFRVNMTKAAGL